MVHLVQVLGPDAVSCDDVIEKLPPRRDLSRTNDAVGETLRAFGDVRYFNK